MRGETRVEGILEISRRRQNEGRGKGGETRKNQRAGVKGEDGRYLKMEREEQVKGILSSGMPATANFRID